MRSYLVLILLFPFCSLAQAQEAPLVRPGAWEVKSGTAGQPMIGYQLCFRTGSQDDIALLLPRAAGPACPVTSLRRDGQDLVWELQCPAAQIAATARYTVSTELIEGKIKVRSGTPPATQKSMISARYVGACARD